MTDVNETILNPETPGAVNPVPVGAADAAEGTAANPAPAAGGTAAMVAAMRQDHAATGSGDDAAAVADAGGDATEAADGAGVAAVAANDAAAVADAGNDDSATSAAADDDDDAAAAGEPQAPGLVQVRRMGRRAADIAAARAEKLREVKARGESSELRDAKAAVAAAGVSLTPAEERDLRDIAEGEDDLRELREEKLEEKRQQAAMRQARSRVNDAVPSRTLVQRPTYGATRGKVYLHVRDTYAFLLGREANPETHKGYIAGMFAASKTMRTLVQGHIAGCPYATWFLVRIEDGMARSREMVKEKEANAIALVEAATPVRLEPFTSRRPAEVPLDFTASYGFHFADILVRFDNVLRILQSYLRQGFITQDEYRAIRQPLAKELRNLFRLPQQWRFVGKDAVMQQTNQLLAAEHDMGRLPQEILDGERLPQLV